MDEMHIGYSSPRAVYIHIPFCKHKCYYCDFNTYALQGQPVSAYLDALERELEFTVKAHPPDLIETIFVGGGTPTVLLPNQMEIFLKMVSDYFPKWAENLEFTMEANPGTTDKEKLQVMKSGGVNRISFGVQSFDNQLLKDIGRIHNRDEVYRSIEDAREIGFDNLSIDLMFGLPNQTLMHMEQSLDAALELELKHYSIYGLKVEENTLFHHLYLKNELPLPSEDDEVQMFQMIINRLLNAGYTHYEISNFAKVGYESRHNKKYWHNQSYYGLGAGAHGYINGYRHVNVKGINEYIASAHLNLPIDQHDKISRQEAMEDFMMVGLRLIQGVQSQDFFDQFGCSIESVFEMILDKQKKRQLIEETCSGYRLTNQGVLLGNEVFAEFIT